MNVNDRRINLDLIEEKCDMEALRQETYKVYVEKYYNKRVKERAFKIGDQVLRKNKSSHIDPRGKLGRTWEGPYKFVEEHWKGSYIL